MANDNDGTYVSDSGPPCACGGTGYFYRVESSLDADDRLVFDVDAKCSSCHKLSRFYFRDSLAFDLTAKELRIRHEEAVAA